MINEPLLRAKDVAQLLGVSEHWVRVRSMPSARTRPDMIPCVKLGHMIRLRPEDIWNYIKAREHITTHA